MPLAIGSGVDDPDLARRVRRELVDTFVEARYDEALIVPEILQKLDLRPAASEQMGDPDLVIDCIHFAAHLIYQGVRILVAGRFELNEVPAIVEIGVAPHVGVWVAEKFLASQ